MKSNPARFPSSFSLVEELKHSNADFPDVRSGIYVHEVVPNSPSHRYVGFFITRSTSSSSGKQSVFFFSAGNALLLSFASCPCRGGIQDGDIIVKVNGRPLVTSSDLQEAVMNESPLLLEVRRGNDDLLFNIEPEVVM